MAVNFFSLFALAGLAAMVFLAVLGLITLLTNPKTRDVAKILLGGLAAMTLLVVLVGGLYLGLARQRAVTYEKARLEVAKRIEHLEQMKQQLEKEGAAASPHDEATPSASDDTPSESSDSGEAADEAKDESPPAPKRPEASDTAELSVPPLPDENRPAWVDRKPYKEGSVYYWPVASDPRPDIAEAEEDALPEALNGAVADYINTKMKLGAVASRQVHLSSDYLRDELVGQDVWIEPLSLSVGDFVRVHALVKFDREANTIIREGWDQQRLVGRIWSASGGLCVVLLFLALVYCYLKIDQVTAGSRRGLLRIAAILVILGLMMVAAGVASVIG